MAEQTISAKAGFYCTTDTGPCGEACMHAVDKVAKDMCVPIRGFVTGLER